MAGAERRRIAPSHEGVRTIQKYIDEQRGRRQSNRVLHGHPSPLFWLNRDISVPAVMAEREAARHEIPKQLNLYVATPYCLPTNPDRCGFCLFPSEVYKNRQQLETYLGYLAREGEMYRSYFIGQPVSSIYFGGGTSNLYKADQYAALLRLVRDVGIVVSPETEITLEGIPQLFTLEKLTAMRDAGINRVSIGAQQLTDDMIAMSGRKQKTAHVFQSIEWCHKLHLPVSIDLIFGWPRQTVAGMLRDLEATVAAGVEHLTHYELNVAGRTDFARNRRHELPSTEDNLEMYRVGRDFLIANGYRQVTTYDWEKIGSAIPTAMKYEDQWRHRFMYGTDESVSGSETWGWGFAGISHFSGTRSHPGWTYMNHTRVDDYVKAIDAGRFPIERGYHYELPDLRLTVLFQLLLSLGVDRRLYTEVVGSDVVREFPDLWAALVEREWASVKDDRIELIGDGVFYTPLIQSLLAQARLDEMRRTRTACPA
jgi:oxygen-independent coproporphyrinogen-3 oxidase